MASLASFHALPSSPFSPFSSSKMVIPTSSPSGWSPLSAGYHWRQEACLCPVVSAFYFAEAYDIRQYRGLGESRLRSGAEEGEKEVTC